MQSQFDYDVIVVGGGPGGATISYLLRLHGLEVLVIDKDIFPRVKLCGGLLTYKTLNLLHRVYGDTVDTLLDKKIINYISHSYELRTQQSTLESGETNFPFVFVDRLVYDNYLLAKAKEIGVNVLEGERVLEVDCNNLCVTTITGKSLKGKIIIGADGANSIVRRAIPKTQLDPKRWKSNLATALEVSIPRKETNSISCPVLYLGVVPWGYAWAFPNRDNIVVGVGCLNPRNTDLRKALDIILSFIGYKPETPYKLRGHPIPYGNFLKKPAYDSILLIGDAAGFVDPLMGEGIYYAQKSAEIAAQSIIKKNNNAEVNLSEVYTQLVRKNITSELLAIKRFRWIVFRMTEIFGNYSLKLIIKIIGAQKFTELIHGLRSYQWNKRGGLNEN